MGAQPAWQVGRGGRRPVLANSCASAATAAEARYRIDSPVLETRATRVVALDAPATALARVAAEQCSDRVGFYELRDADRATPDGSGADESGRDRAVLTDLRGRPLAIGDAMDGADLVILVATSDEGTALAPAVGRWCSEKSIMTAGLVVSRTGDAQPAVSALRPHARMLLSSRREDDLAQILTALRA